jgi:hypothetical protein
MKVIAFTDDQMATLLEYLEDQAGSGYTIEDVIEGIKDGTIIRTTDSESQSV